MCTSLGSSLTWSRDYQHYTRPAIVFESFKLNHGKYVTRTIALAFLNKFRHANLWRSSPKK